MIEKMKEKFTKYEVARILGARALQLAMDAPVLLKIDKEKLEEINYDVLKIAEFEFQEGVLPITVKRPFPKKVEEKIKKISKEESSLLEKETLERKKKEEKEKQIEGTEDKEVEQKEQLEEEKIKEEGEIMALATPEDEVEETVEEEAEGEI